MLRIVLVACGALSLLLPAGALPARADPVSVTMTYLGKAEPPAIPLSLVEPVLTDEGIQGARLGIADNQTTGRFLKQEFKLVERLVPQGGDVGAAFTEGIAAGERLFIADLRAEDLLPLVSAAEKAGAILLNSRTTDDARPWFDRSGGGAIDQRRE